MFYTTDTLSFVSFWNTRAFIVAKYTVYVTYVQHAAKRVEHTWKLLPTRQFLAAKSRCTMFNVSRYFIPDATCVAMQIRLP